MPRDQQRKAKRKLPRLTLPEMMRDIESMSGGRHHLVNIDWDDATDEDLAVRIILIPALVA